MKTIKLDPRQISELINNKKVILHDNSSIEFYDDEIIHNENGEIRYIKNINLAQSLRLLGRRPAKPV